MRTKMPRFTGGFPMTPSDSGSSQPIPQFDGDLRKRTGRGQGQAENGEDENWFPAVLLHMAGLGGPGNREIRGGGRVDI